MLRLVIHIRPIILARQRRIMHIVKSPMPAPKLFSMQPFVPEPQFIRQQYTFLVRGDHPNKNSRKPQFHKRNSHHCRNRLAGISTPLKRTPDEIRQLCRRHIPNNIFHLKLPDQLLRLLPPDAVTKSLPAVPLLNFFLHKQIRLLLILKPACHLRKIAHQQLPILLHHFQYPPGIRSSISPQHQPFTLQHLGKSDLCRHAAHFRNFSSLESTLQKLQQGPALLRLSQRQI